MSREFGLDAAFPEKMTGGWHDLFFADELIGKAWKV